MFLNLPYPAPFLLAGEGRKRAPATGKPPINGPASATPPTASQSSGRFPPLLTFSAGMKRSRSGRGEFSSRPTGAMSRARSTICGPMSVPSFSARSKPSPRSPCKPWCSHSLQQFGRQVGAFFSDRWQEARLQQCVQHRGADRGHQRVAVVGAALVARLEARRILRGTARPPAARRRRCPCPAS